MTGLEHQIQKNYQDVKDKIRVTAERCGRDPGEIKLVVVTKAQPVNKIKAVLEAGATLLGENYPEETEGKISELNAYSQIEWQMIGHLQGRKIPIVINHFKMLHSLDSLDLAEKINKKCTELNKVMQVLIEINISGEESKNGFSAWKESEWVVLAETIKNVNNLPGLKVCGLMTMPPYFEDLEKARPYFARLRKLSDYLKHVKELSNSMAELSMGTSGDYPVAIEEGATFIRVGQAILGERIYH